MQLSKTEFAIKEHRALFPTTVKRVTDGMGKTELVLKSSTHKKLKKKISIGKYKVFPMVSLTLEDRATCSTHCVFYDGCYGDNMPFAIRYKIDPSLLIQIEKDLVFYSNKYPLGFLVRLHVLGDFNSISYVKFWERMLIKFKALHIFGYTARHDNMPDKLSRDIATHINRLRSTYGFRFAVRDSNNNSHNFTALYMDTPIAKNKLQNKELFVCPVQLNKVDDCADCCLGWTSLKAVGFINHRRKALSNKRKLEAIDKQWEAIQNAPI